MASYKSHMHPPRRVEEQTPYTQRNPATRLPQRSVTPTTALPTQSSVSGHSKLQKRKPTRDEVIQSGRRTAGGTTSSVPTTHVPSNTVASKTVRQASSSRLPKLEVVGTTRTPSLVSGSSASTTDSPRSNALRRKPSSIGTASGRQTSRSRAGSMSPEEEEQRLRMLPGGFKDPFSETVLGISLPASSSIYVRSGSDVETDTRVYDFETGPAQILPLPIPQYALSTTPSTRYSESPGPFSVSSTPTSMSSYSPGVALSTKGTTRLRQTSPLQSRPPVARHRTPDDTSLRQQHALSSVRESSLSSSSASTVIGEGMKQRERQSPKRLPAPPPSPPLRVDSTVSEDQPARAPLYTKSRVAPTPVDRSRVQAPPELAHLADRPPPPPPSTEARRPRRPSRDGTTEIVGLKRPSPIIQSNLSIFPSSHRRTSSTESSSGLPRSRFGLPIKPSSRNPSPNPSMQSGHIPVSRGPTPGPTPEVVPQENKSRSNTLPSPAPAPAPSPSKTHRFGFFRRTKTEPAPEDSKADKKLRRRGPAAGTGHEGYGRYAVRGRSGSSVSGGSIGRSPSAGTTTESLDRTPSSRKSSVTSTTTTEMDDFFLERLAPVSIRGTGSSTELTRSPEPMRSGSSVNVAGLAMDGSRSQPVLKPKTVTGHDQPKLLPSAMSDPVRGQSPIKRLPFGRRRPSESEDDIKKSSNQSVPRRSSRSSKLMEGMPLSKVDSKDSNAHRRKGSTSSGHAADIKEGKWFGSKREKVEKTEKAASKPTKRWNFFQRAHGTPRVESPATDPTTLPAAPRMAPSRSVAHYALIDSDTGIDMQDIEQIMKEADSTPDDLSPPEDHSDTTHNQPETKERLQSMLLPPKPILPRLAPPARPASPKVSLRSEVQSEVAQGKLTINTNIRSASIAPALPSLPDLTPVTDLSPSSSPFRPLSPAEPESVQELPQPVLITSIADPLPSAPPPPALALPPPPPPPRPSRLPQVGRIPQVVSRRNQDRRPPSQSFSRPFATNQHRPNAPSRTSFDSIGSLTVTAGPAEPYPVLQGLDALSHESAIATMSPTAEEANRQSEFFKFPPRKDSEVSYSSSSGVWSFPAASGTAIPPMFGSPASEDEVWKEYDDLIDEVLSPLEEQALRRESKRQKSAEPLPLRVKTSRTSSASGASATGVSNPSLHLRRSRLLAVLHSAQSPTSPMSFSEFLQDYGERNLSVVDPVTGRLSFPSTARVSTGSAPRHRASSTRSSLPASLSLSTRQSKATIVSNSSKDRESASANRYRDTRFMEMAEAQSDGLLSMANLRFGALMTSKWLSFGRVLFSPAHFELKDPIEDRVLVIDGLGKDWSFYCALTYPEATVFNLGPGESSSTFSEDDTSNESLSTLSNHRHISHQSLSGPLPFPKGYFACVVLRFLPALPSSVHRSLLSECKRVLRPGGHLELSVMDLDLVNMGNRARRAVRGLKVKMQVADEEVSLRNMSDEIMANVGRKGFIECNRCFVGVPVAGKLPQPGELDTREGGKRKGSLAESLTKPNGAPKPPKQPKPEVSYSDLLNTRSSSQSNEEGIADMVARVGRWWYSRCFEALVLPEAGEPGAATSGNLLETSIWRDETLINECEKRGTSFRLLIGYAQKPEVGFRRTVSV